MGVAQQMNGDLGRITGRLGIGGSDGLFVGAINFSRNNGGAGWPRLADDDQRRCRRHATLRP